MSGRAIELIKTALVMVLSLALGFGVIAAILVGLILGFFGHKYWSLVPTAAWLLVAYLIYYRVRRSKLW